MTWPTAPLGDLCNVISGGTPKRSNDEYWNGDIAWVKISDMLQGEITSTDEYITDLGLKESPARLLEPGTLLLSIFATVGRTAILAIPAATNQAIVGLQLKTDALNRAYLRHFLDSQNPALKQKSRGVAQDNINTSILKQLQIPLPPLQEQRRIAAILDKVNSLREISQSNQQTLQALERKAFLDLFGDPVCNDKGWSKGCVGDLVSRFETGKSIGSGEGDISETLRIIRVSAVSSGCFKPGESKPAPRDYSPAASHSVNQGDLLFCRANTDALIGTVAYVEHPPLGLLLSDKVWRFCWRDSASYFPLYVKQLFGHPSVRQEIRRRATGTSGSMLNISQSSVLEIPIALPPVDIQKKFHSIASACLNIYSRNARQNERFAALASSLGHSLLGR
jgi:type I restriction enzyme S subunit